MASLADLKVMNISDNFNNYNYDNEFIDEHIDKVLLGDKESMRTLKYYSDKTIERLIKKNII